MICEIINATEEKEFKSGRVGYGFYKAIKIKDYPHRISLNIIAL